jgi:outer membrane protein insertion porin family
VRRVALAILITAAAVGTALAQTPYPVPVPPDEVPKPTPPPDDGPKPTPVPVQEEPKPTPIPLGPDNKPIDQKPAPSPTPAPVQKPAPAPVQKPAPTPTPAPQQVKPTPPADLKIEQKAEPTTPPAQINADLIGGEEITRIVVEDNTKTTSDTVEVIAGIEKGDTWTAAMVDVVKTRLVSSGLFKDVEVYWTKEPGGVAIHILAKDKHSWVIAPAVYSQPTNKGGGIGFGENNLFGQNQKLLLYGQIATGDTFFIGAWLIPNIGGTRFYGQLDTYLKSARNIEYTAPTSWLIDKGELRPVRESRIHYLNFGANLGVELWRGVKIGTRLRAASVSYKDVKLAEGASIGDVTGNPADTMVPTPGAEGMDISNEWNFQIDRRANWYGVTTGHRYAMALEHSLESFGSDFKYWLFTVSALKAYKVFNRHNFVLKGTTQYGSDLPFQQELMTGGTSMRGWLNNEFRGDFRALANIEYSFPIMTIAGFSVRGLTFLDSSYTTFIHTNEMANGRDYLPNSEVRGLDGFKNSVGVGTRFYLRQIVLPLLGLDFGYGLEARDYQVYLAIGLTD